MQCSLRRRAAHAPALTRHQTHHIKKEDHLCPLLGIIGSGNIGAAIARLAVAAEISVVISNSRGPESLAGSTLCCCWGDDAVGWLGGVIVCLPWLSAERGTAKVWGNTLSLRTTVGNVRRPKLSPTLAFESLTSSGRPRVGPLPIPQPRQDRRCGGGGVCGQTSFVARNRSSQIRKENGGGVPIHPLVVEVVRRWPDSWPGCSRWLPVPSSAVGCCPV